MGLFEVSILRFASHDSDASIGAVASTPALDKGVVHVWVLSDEVAESWCTNVIDWLTPEELLRARRFRRNADRTSSVVRRGVLRGLVARYCECAPQSVDLAVLDFGKLQLAGNTTLAFSVSRAQGMVLFAFAREATVGVDIERPVDNSDIDGVAEQVFCAAELAALQACGPSERPTFFGTTFVRKEALLKALGIGFSGQVLAYSTLGGVVRYQGVFLQEWYLRDLDVGPGWHAALAVGPKA